MKSTQLSMFMLRLINIHQNCGKKNKRYSEEEALTVIVMNYLKVFHRRLCYAAVEIQHVGLGVVVPHRGLVVQLNQVLQWMILPPVQETLLLLQNKDTHVQVWASWITVHIKYFRLRTSSLKCVKRNQLESQNDIFQWSWRNSTIRTRGCQPLHDSIRDRLTFGGLTGTLSKFMLMLGMITVILRGPLNPSTLVSCQKGTKTVTISLGF